MPNLFDYVRSINEKKVYYDGELTDYSQWLVNIALSLHVDTLFYANEMNRYAGFLDDRLHYDYLYHSIRQKKRWAEWPKKLPKDSLIEAISTVYKYNRQKAHQALSILTDEQLKTLEAAMNKGGAE